MTGMRLWIVIAASATALAGCASSAGAPADSAGASGASSVGTASVGTASSASAAAGVVGGAGGPIGAGGVPAPFRPGAHPSIAPGGPLTEAANGGHVTVSVGAHIAVRLDPPNAAQTWDMLVLSPSGLVQVQDEQGGYPSRAPMTATLVATAAGTVSISSQSDQACLHATPRCLPPQFVWSVKLTVTP